MYTVLQHRVKGEREREPCVCLFLFVLSFMLPLFEVEVDLVLEPQNRATLKSQEDERNERFLELLFDFLNVIQGKSPDSSSSSLIDLFASFSSPSFCSVGRIH